MSLRIQVSQNDEVSVDEVGGGGGNPNYVETIEGTLENPWGSLNPQVLHSQLLNNEVSVYIKHGNSDNVPVYASTQSFQWSFLIVSDQGDFINGTKISYYTGGTVDPDETGGFNGSNKAYTYTAVDLSTPCTLTIIHHPLPTN